MCTLGVTIGAASAIHWFLRTPLKFAGSANGESTLKNKGYICFSNCGGKSCVSQSVGIGGGDGGVNGGGGGDDGCGGGDAGCNGRVDGGSGDDCADFACCGGGNGDDCGDENGGCNVSVDGGGSGVCGVFVACNGCGVCGGGVVDEVTAESTSATTSASLSAVVKGPVFKCSCSGIGEKALHTSGPRSDVLW